MSKQILVQMLFVISQVLAFQATAQSPHLPELTLTADKSDFDVVEWERHEIVINYKDDQQRPQVIVFNGCAFLELGNGHCRDVAAKILDAKRDGKSIKFLPPPIAFTVRHNARLNDIKTKFNFTMPPFLKSYGLITFP